MVNRFVLNAVSYHGNGAIKEIPGIVSAKGFKKAFIASDPDLVKFGVTKKVTDLLDEAGMAYEVYSDIKPNPTIENVKSGVAAYKASGADYMITIGGGSSMDTGKAIGIIINNPEFADVRSLEGVADTKKPCVPIIAIPTTAGTAAEVTINYVITDTEKNRKMVCVDVHDIPVVAVVDPEMMASMPKGLTAATGMDALTHAIEAYISWTYNTKESLRLAEEAVKLIFDNLELAYQHGEDLKVRENMMIAAFKAGFAFSRAGVGNVHAIAHTLGGLYNTPHGLANAVILPIVLEDYGEAVYPKLARLCEIAGVKTDGTDAEKARAFIAEIYAMNERMGIPKGFDFIQAEDIPQIVTWALAEANPNYPVPVVYNAARCRKVIDTIRAKATENPPVEAAKA